jgi:hypothetical protein
VPHSETIVRSGIWQARASAFCKGSEAGGLHHHDAAHPAQPGAGDDADRLLLARGREGREERIGLDRGDQRHEHAIGHRGDMRMSFCRRVAATMLCQVALFVPSMRGSLRRSVSAPFGRRRRRPLAGRV